MHVRVPLALLLVALAIIAAFWWALGRPVPMPPPPLAEGEKIPCVSYAPFRRGQSPFTENIAIPATQIDEDFAHLATVTDCVRTYAVDQGLEHVPELARKHGLEVILGIWIGRDAVSNERQIETGVRLANDNADVVRLLVVGNETLLRGENSAETLGAILKRVKAAVSVPVTYADVWEFWVKNRSLADLVDVVTVHILPYWEDEPVPAEQAAAHIADIREHVGEVFRGKDILIGETGWPSRGRMRWGARATPADQARVLHDIVALKRERGFDVNLIEAFDQPWKRLLEGTVGGYWGLLDADSREPKFRWGAPVSNHPDWKRSALLGAALTVLVFASAAMAAGRRHMPLRRWLAVGALASISGCAIGLAVHMQVIGARSLLEVGRSSVYLAFAAAGPVIAAAAIAGGARLLPMSSVLAGASGGRRLDVWLSVMAAGTCVLATYFALGLVFDPRYREFETATLAGPVAGIVLAVCCSGLRSSGLSERLFALIFAASAVVIVVQERLSNWEALGFAGLLVVLAVTLGGLPAGRKQEAAAPAPAH